MGERKVRQDEKDSDAKRSLSFQELITIVLSGHLGVRKREQRVNDFDRANGLHVFIVAVLYFALIVTGLIVLVSYITG
jgi:Protein of unknown function (DUF2970)